MKNKEKMLDIKSNFFINKAVTLAKGARKQIAQTSLYCFCRWYKFTIPAGQMKKITITVNGGLDVCLLGQHWVPDESGDWDWFDDSISHISMKKTYNGNGYQLTSKIELGHDDLNCTYYIVVDEDPTSQFRYPENSMPGGDISWKYTN